MGWGGVGWGGVGWGGVGWGGVGWGGVGWGGEFVHACTTSRQVYGSVKAHHRVR